MRERISRGKRTDNNEGEFVYGIPVEGEPLLGMGKRTYIITKPGVQWVDGVYMTYDECIEVDPDTVSDYTGLTDRNNKMIFEGDIVSGTAYSSEWIGVIVWIDEIATFGVRYFHRTDPTAWQNSSILTAVSRHKQDKFAAQVIGNIYDNPELLKGGAGNE